MVAIIDLGQVKEAGDLQKIFGALAFTRGQQDNGLVLMNQGTEEFGKGRQKRLAA
jgi:hypothetical protein